MHCSVFDQVVMMVSPFYHSRRLGNYMSTFCVCFFFSCDDDDDDDWVQGLSTYQTLQTLPWPPTVPAFAVSYFFLSFLSCCLL